MFCSPNSILCCEQLFLLMLGFSEFQFAPTLACCAGFLLFALIMYTFAALYDAANVPCISYADHSSYCGSLFCKDTLILTN